MTNASSGNGENDGSGLSEVPAIRTFQFDADGIGKLKNSVNMFRGDVNFPLTLLTLPGSSGLDVNLTAIYESNVQQQVKLWNLDAPTGIIGLGWSMPYEQIVVQNSGSGARADEQIYLLSGGANRLIRLGTAPDGAFIYQAQNFQFWNIYYYPSDERWEITKENGVTSIYGGGVGDGGAGTRTSAGDSVQWGVKWGNWIGSSAVTANQQYYARAWNLSATRNLWNQSIQFEYLNIKQAVGQGGKSYTKACYLKKIRGVYGRTANFNYADKIYQPGQVCEYQDPHKEQPNDLADAYQSRYETKYLDYVEVQSETNTRLFSIHFDYDLFNAGGSGQADFPFLWKRRLTSIRQANGDFESLPGMQFEYYDRGDAHPGAIKLITYPEGGEVKYNYALLSLPTNRDVQILNPFTGGQTPGTPRVWFGADYAVVTWFDGAGGRLQISIYSWLGRWVNWNLPGIISAKFDLDTLSVVTGQNFFALHFKENTANQERVYLFRRDPLKSGQWTNEVHFLGLKAKASATTAVSGDDFVVFYNPSFTQTIFQGFAWNWRQRKWIPPSLPTVTVSDPPAVRLAAGQNCYVVCSYNRQTKLAQFQLLSRDELGNWGKNSAWSNQFNVYQSSTTPTDFFLELSMGASFVVATYLTELNSTSATYELRIFQWDENFNVINPSSPLIKSYSSSLSGSQLQMPVLETLVAASLVGNCNHLLRYVGSGATIGWLNFDMGSPTDPAAKYDFAYQADAAVLSKSVSGSVTNLVTTFNPNVPTSAGWSSQNLANPGVSPTIGMSYMTAGNRAYYQGPSGRWTQLPTPLPGNLDLPSVQNRAPNYIVYQDYQGSNTRTYVALLRNGAISRIITLTPTPQKVYVTQDNPQPGTNLAGPTSFFTYPSTQAFDTALSLHLYQIDDDAVQGPVVDIPVSYLEIDDGYKQDNPYLQAYRYDPTGVVIETDTRVAQYPKVSVLAGTKDATGPSPNGRTEYYFSNGYSGLGGTFYPVGWVFNYQLILNGVLLGTRSYDANNKLVAQNVGYWSVINTAGQNFLYGGYFRQIKSENTLDGVTQTIETTFDATTGFPTQTTTYSLLGHTQEKVFTKEFTYAWQVEPYASDLLAKHLFQPVVQTITRTDQTVTSSSVATWQNWDESGQTWKWAPFQTYKWKGAAGEPAFDFTPGAQRLDWLKVSEIVSLDLTNGANKESFDASGTHNSFIYDKHAIFQVASFVNASISDNQAGYLGFEDYEDMDQWTISAETPIVKNEANTGRNSLKLPPGTSGPAREFQAPESAGDFILSCWVKTQAGFGSDSGSAAWEIQVAHEGNPLGQPITTPIVETGGDWVYLFQLVHLIQLRKDNGLSPNEPLSLSVTSFNHKQTRYLLLDDIRVAPVACNFVARTLEPHYRLQTAQINGNGATARSLYDGFQRKVATIGPGGVSGPVSTVSSLYYSRQGNAGIFNPEDPNRNLTIQARNGGFYENLLSGDSWEQHWNPDGNWTQQDNELVHAGGQSGTLTLANPSLTQSYGAAFRVSADEVLQNELGINIGQEITVKWNPANSEWSLSVTGESQPVSASTPIFNLKANQFAANLDAGQVTGDMIGVFSGFGAALSSGAVIAVVAQGTSWTIKDQQFNQIYYILKDDDQLSVNRLARQWILSLGEKTLLFYADGQQVFSYITATPIVGAPQLFVTDTVAYSDLLVFQDPQVKVALSDGAGRQKQAQVLRGEQAIISETVFDDLGLAAVQTKSAFVSPNSERVLLDYRDDFVTSLEWTTGVMTGKVVDAYPNDEGYPYSRQLYEFSPLSRVIEKGLPGKDFAINLTNPNRHTTKYAYSASDGSFGYEAENYYVRMTVDAQGTNALQFTDKTGAPMGQATNLGSDLEPNYSQSANLYDAYGNVVAVREPNYFQPPHGSADDWVIHRTYDFFGNVTSETTPDCGTTKTIYDQAARPRFFEDAEGADKGYLIYRKYDVLGRLVETGYYPFQWDEAILQAFANNDPSWPPAAETWRKKQVYDGEGADANLLGRLWKVQVNNNYSSEADVFEEFAYDIAGRVLKKQLRVTEFSGTDYVVNYQYDNLGNMTEIVYPETGSVGIKNIVYSYDDRGQMIGVGTSTADPFYYAAYDYNADGSMARETLNQGGGTPFTRTFSFNSPGWPKQLDASFQGGAGEFSVALDYTSGGYSSDGKNDGGYYNGLVAQQINMYKWQQGAPAPTDYAYHYDYDQIGQLQTAAETPDHTYDFGVGVPVGYDPNGNILEVDRAGAISQYDYCPPTGTCPGSNRVYSIKTADGAVARAFGYDLNGNINSVTNPKNLSLSYDQVSYKPRQVVVTENDKTEQTVSYAYDGNQQRVYKSAQGGSTPGSKIYLQGINAYPLVEQVRAGEQLSTTFYIYGPSGLIAYQRESKTRYVLKDQQGSTRIVLDTNGAVAGGYDYWPYGTVARQYGEEDLIPYLYTGQEYEAELGLYNFKARFYDSDLCRFYGPDPARQFYCPYIYGANNPILFVDPSGELAWWEGLLIAIGVTIGLLIIGAVVTVLTGGAAAPEIIAAETEILSEESVLLGGSSAVSYGSATTELGTSSALQGVNVLDSVGLSADPVLGSSSSLNVGVNLAEVEEPVIVQQVQQVERALPENLIRAVNPKNQNFNGALTSQFKLRPGEEGLSTFAEVVDPAPGRVLQGVGAAGKEGLLRAFRIPVTSITNSEQQGGLGLTVRWSQGELPQAFDDVNAIHLDIVRPQNMTVGDFNATYSQLLRDRGQFINGVTYQTN